MRTARNLLGLFMILLWIGFLNDLFDDLAISHDRQRCQFLFCSMKNPLLCRSARPESSREVRKRCLMAPFARTQSEPRRRLALASGFALFRSFGIDRLDELAHGAVSAWPMHGRTRRSRISLKDVSSECSTMVLAFPGTSPLSF